MFVQYSFVQPRPSPALHERRRPFAPTPSQVVAAGIAAMLVTTGAFLWG